MEQVARARNAQRPGAHRLRDDSAHLGDVVAGRGFEVGAAFAHHVNPQRAARNLRREVNIASRRSRASRQSGKLSQFHGTPFAITISGMSSTPSISLLTSS